MFWAAVHLSCADWVPAVKPGHATFLQAGTMSTKHSPGQSSLKLHNGLKISPKKQINKLSIKLKISFETKGYNSGIEFVYLIHKGIEKLL
jgi:hypothetical protein